MINTMVDLKDIRFEERDPGILFNSIRERGMAIPVHVKKVANGYICTDGNRRLTACKMLGMVRVEVLLENDFSKAGSSFWGNTLNHH